MAPVSRLDAMRASVAPIPHHDPESVLDDAIDFGDFEEEMKRLSAANAELMQHFGSGDNPDTTLEAAPNTDADELALLRVENAELKARLQELEAIRSGQGEELWLERQREYEMLLEEKSDVIRNLHQKIQEIQESAIGGCDIPSGSSASVSSTRLGQAEEILRLKREMEEQRRQLEQDEEEMMGQMRQMEMTMAKERAEMARQRQEMLRLQADLAREIENSARAPELRERLQSLRRTPDLRQTPPPTPLADMPKPEPSNEPQSSGLLRRIFG
jgi:hypothetical protein